MVYYNIWLDIQNRKLLWLDQVSRDNYPQTREIVTIRERIQEQRINSEHQADIIQRDQQVTQILACPKKASTVLKPQTFAREHQYNLEKMKKELLKVEEEPKLLPPV